MSADEIFGPEPEEAEIVWFNREGDEPDPTLQAVPFAEADSWTPRNLAELEDRPPVEPTLGGLGLCYPGKRHVFSGPQESAKTLAAYVIGLSVVRQGERVLLIDFEMGPWDAKTRLRELGASDDELAAFLYVEPEVSPSEASTSALVVGSAPALVIIDAAAGAFALESLDDNARKDVERWANAWVTPFWKAGIATIVLDHVTKNAETRGNYAIGSERKVGGADVHLGFSVISPIRRGAHGRYQITTHKDRGGCLKRGKLATFELHSDPETHHFTWGFVAQPETDEEHPFRPTVLMEKVSRYLEQQYGPVPMSQLEKDIIGKRDFIRQAVALLVDEGYLTEAEGARNARLMTSERAYRESSDDLAPTSPHLAPESAETDLAHLALPPMGEGRGDGRGERGGATSPQTLLEDDDEIPF